MICSGCSHKTERGCSALTQIQKDACAFYRTDEQAAESREKANARLRGLPDTTQRYIAEKYYNKKKIWEG